MKITFFGTAAAEGFPGLFCNCKYCARARELGGKNIRSRTQALINDDLLIDLPPDTMSHFQQHGVRGDKLRTLIFTHGHSDHYFPSELRLRGSWYAHDMEAEALDVLCPDTVFDDCVRVVEGAQSEVKAGIKLHRAAVGETVVFGDYGITPLRARHDFGRSAVIYLIKQGEKTLLYAHDTGYFYDEVFEYLRDNGIRLDLATFDCTNAHLPSSKESSHMGFDNVGLVIDRLRNDGVVNGSTILFVNHFSHNGNPLHEDMLRSAERIGCDVAYDGCSVEF